MKRYLLLILTFVVFASVSFGQAISVNGGSIQGEITDPSGAKVPGAAILVTNPATGFSKSLQTDSAGYYVVGPLDPGNYQVTVTAQGFQALKVNTVVRIGTATSGSFRLTLGAEQTIVEVNAGAIQVNTDQIGVSDVLTNEQIQSLPVNGRNFLDVAQIEPGVILQDASTFDPTKAGYTGLSISGVSGRTVRILLDGQDISDETVGTTIFNVSQGSIDQFQLNRSTQDVSGEVTSTGQVLVSTNSGSNRFHGMAFYNFQDYRAGFATSKWNSVASSENPPLQRNQFGGSLGGFLIKDRLFFFANSERIQQAQALATQANSTLYPAISASFPTVKTPYKDTYSAGRMDYNGPWGGHYFARANYQADSAATNRNQGYWLFANRDNTYGFAFGADFQKGRTTHSFRGSYEKFHNLISDMTAGNKGLYDPIPGFAFYNTAAGLYAGPHYLAPQATYQSDKQLRYDGSFTHGTHNIRFGASTNRIQEGLFASFFGLSPRATTSASTFIANAAAGCVSASAAMPDPTQCYYTSLVYIGNGQGQYTNQKQFGLPNGGTSAWRMAWYVGDSWKMTSSLTVSAGVRYSFDTNRALQNLPAPPCSDITNPVLGTPCTGSTDILSLWNPNFKTPVHQPYGDFSPQLGVNFSPGNHKTSFRAAIGIFHESDVVNNTTNAEKNILKSGILNTYPTICGGTNSISIPQANGTSTTWTTIDGTPGGASIATICSQPIAQSAASFITLENNYKAATITAGAQSNSTYVANTLKVSTYSPLYKTPYSIQINGGVQRELWKGAVISADFVHNATLHIGETTDLNHVGAARTLNTAAAQNAITTVINSKSACVGQTGTAGVQCAINAGATLSNFSSAGLDSGNVTLSGYPAVYRGKTVATGAAFPGVNPALGNGTFIQPIGHSAYDALQVVYRQQKRRPLPGLDNVNLQVAYTLSRYITTSFGGSDEFFNAVAWDYDNPNLYMGRGGLDHTHQLNMGGVFTFRYGLEMGLIGHFYSAPPSTLTLDNTSGSAGQIFQTDVTGDGTNADPVPGTNVGDYMHAVKGSTLAGLISTFNSKYANTLTPAGQALVNAGLMTQAQLVSIGAAIQPIAAPTNGSALMNPAFRMFDARFAYPIPIGKYLHREGMTLKPGVAIYNVFNMANFSSPSSTLLNQAHAGGLNYLNGPNNSSVQFNNRIQRSVGTYDQGGARSTEFQLMLNF